MKNTLYVLAGLLLFACGTKKMAETGDATEALEVKAEIAGQKEIDPPASIDNIKLKGNYLMMDVTFAGACPEDAVGVYGSEMLTKSLPPIRNVSVSRIKSANSCDEFITKRVKVDLRNLAYKQEAGSEIILQIDGVRDQIRYIYE